MKKGMFILMPALLLVYACTPKVPDEPATLAAPTGLKLHSSTETTLTFQWTAVERASGYDWNLKNGPSDVSNGTVTARNVSIDGLEPGTGYRFGVRAKNNDGLFSEMAYLEASTQAPTDPVDPVDPVDPPGPNPESITYSDFLIPAAEEDGKARAFPGAEGGGMYTTGGRGGKVLHVTSLEDTSSQGTLRWAVTQNYPRIIVFDVAGVIELKSTLNINRNDVTIAGQTAPGDGICLKNYRVAINASNVIIRYIRCRMGDEKKTEDDAMNIMTHENGQFKNIIIDHCSLSWSTDECASFYGMNDFSFQWNIVSESLRNSVHGKGAHGYGGIWGGENASYHHNLLAHHDSRNPRIDHDYVSTQKGPVSLVNNVIYNWGSNSCYGGESANNTNTYKQYNVINNYYKPGPATGSGRIWFIDPTKSCSNCSKLGTGDIVPGHFYMTGNVMEGNSAMSEDNWKGTTASEDLVKVIRASAPFTYSKNPCSISIQPAADAFTSVVAYAGASYSRDNVDKRVCSETKYGTFTYTGSNGSRNGLIDTQSDVGGWPSYKYESRDKDSDSDGMPDWFEDAAGLDKSKSSDGPAYGLDPKSRYTNLEMYLHYLVRETIAGQNANGTYTKL